MQGFGVLLCSTGSRKCVFIGKYMKTLQNLRSVLGLPFGDYISDGNALTSTAGLEVWEK